MTKLQYVYVSRVAIQDIIEKSKLYKTIWTNTESIQFLDNAIYCLTKYNLTLYLWRRDFQNQFEMCYSSGGTQTVIDYPSVSKLYEWAGYASEYNYFEHGGGAVLIGVDMEEKEKWQKKINSSQLSVDNLMDLHFSERLYLSKTCLPTKLTPEEQEKLISEFEDYRAKIKQREILAEIQKQRSSVELLNAYFSPGEASLSVFAENARDYLFSKVHNAFHDASRWSEPRIEINNQTRELIAQFYKS